MLRQALSQAHDRPDRADNRPAFVNVLGQQGQAIVEFALAFGVLVLLFFGIVGMTWVFFAWLSANSASREGARYVIGKSDATDNEVITHICNTTVAMGGSAASCNSLVSSGQVTISVEPSTITSRVSGAQITVNVAYRVPVPTLRASFFNGGGITFLGPIWVSSTSNMRLE